MPPMTNPLEEAPTKRQTMHRSKHLGPRLVLLAATISLTISKSDCVAAQVRADSKFTEQSNHFRDAPIFNTDSLYTPNANHYSANLNRAKRSTGATGNHQQQFVDACQSKMEVLTPYHATNSKGKVRTIVNSELMQQAIQVETCARSNPGGENAGKCNSQPDCGCEQKYKWHRLLVSDPTESDGLFMDWFLFPSNCVCRCKNSPHGSSRSFHRLLSNKNKL